MKIPPWFWLVVLFILPLIAWAVLGYVTSKANIKPISVPTPAARHNAP